VGPQGPAGGDASEELAEQRELIDALIALARQGGGPYACRCDEASCGNGAASGSRGALSTNMPTASMLLLHGPDRTGADDTGWSCEHNAFHTCVCEGSCGNDAAGGADGAVDTGLTGLQVLSSYHPDRTDGRDTGWACAVEDSYTCLCEGSCGNDAFGGSDGEIATGVSAASMISDYSPHRTGGADTGWACAAEGTHTCVCRGSCGNGATGASDGDIHSGLSAQTVLTAYGPQRTGFAATGWSCGLNAP